MSYVLRPASPSDAGALAALGLDVLGPRGLTEADLFVYPHREAWLAERGGAVVSALRLCTSHVSGQALLTDLTGDEGALLALVDEVGHAALGTGATHVRAAAPTGAPLTARLASSGFVAQRRVVHVRWHLPTTPPGNPPADVRCELEQPDPEEYAELAVEAYKGSWDWLFEHWGGDVAARRNFARLFEAPRAERFIAAREGRLLKGFVSAGDGDVLPGDFSTFGVLVHPGARGRGIGGHLLLLALDLLARRGARQADMHTTAPPQGDPPAVRLYLRSGQRVQDMSILRQIPRS